MQCPRCGKPMNPDQIKNALSRHEDTYICSTCGAEEAMLDYQRKPPLSRELWHDKDKYISQFQQVDRTLLKSKDEVVEYLKENGEHEPSLAEIGHQYESTFGIDLIWKYPLTDNIHEGAFIVPVQEGFMWLPYDEIDREYYEILLPDEATMLDTESCAYFMESLRHYTNDLCKVFSIILQSKTHKEG